MNRQRTAMIVYVDLDPRQGMMHTPESTKDIIQDTLNSRMPHYKPTVELLPKDYPGTPKGARRAYLVATNLDPVPGLMHTVESAQTVVRNIVFQRVPQYAPIVVAAPTTLLSDYVS